MSINKILKSIIMALVVVGALIASTAFAAFAIPQGGTGTSTYPAVGQFLQGTTSLQYYLSTCNTAYAPLCLNSGGNFTGKIIQFLTASTSLSSIVLDEGEIGYATNTKATFIGDGTTAGGNPIGFWRLGTTTANSTTVSYTAGRVGIGTINPGARLDVQTKTANEEIFNGQNTSNGGQATIDSTGQLFLTNGVIANGTSLFEQITSGGPSFNITDGPTGDPDFSITGDTDAQDLAVILGNSSNTYPTLKLFRATPSDLTTNYALFSDTKVGIGTTSPVSTLAVVGTTTVTQGIVSQGLATSTFSGTIKATCFTTNGTSCISGGGGSPGGSNTQVQYNNSGSFAGSSNLTFDGTNLTVAGSVTAGVNFLAGNKFAFSADPTHSFLIGDGSNNVFLQSGAAISIVPSAGSNLNLAPSAGGIVSDSASKTGIGTTSPIGFLSLTPGSSAIPAFVVASTSNAIEFIVDKTGKIGIGTSTPSNTLEVNGNEYLSGNFTTANITATGTITLPLITNSVLATDATGKIVATTTGGGGGSGTVGSGTTGQVPYYAGSGTTLTATSTLFLTNQNVGIGNTSPSSLLDVGTFNCSLYTVRTGSFILEPCALNNGFLGENSYYNGSSWTRLTNGYASGFQFYNGQVLMYADDNGSGNFTNNYPFKVDYKDSGTVALGGNVPSTPGTYTGSTMVVLGTGNVGIDTASPSNALEVNGAISTVGQLTALKANIGSLDEISGLSRYLTFGPDNSTPGAFEIYQGSANNAVNRVPLYIGTSGKVGIGSTTPGSTLTVAGNGYFAGNITATGTLTIQGTGTSTFAGGINIASGCFAVAGTCVGGGGGSSQWTTTGSNIYYNTGSVGVGTTTFPYKLTVGGNIDVTDIYSNQAFFGNATGTSIVLGSIHDVGSTLGLNNFIFGAGAGQFANGGGQNIIGGLNAGQNVTGGENIILGDGAGDGNVLSGTANVILGQIAGASNTTGATNVFLGYQAGTTNTSGADNVFIGDSVGLLNSTASQNVAIGRSACATLSTLGSNTCLGYNAGVSATGYENTFLGTAAGASQSGGAYNIAIGNGADLADPNGDQQLNIGGLIFGTGTYNGSGSHSAIPTGGNVGIGTSTPDSNLDVSGNVKFEGKSSFVTTAIGGAIISGGCDTVTTTGLDTTMSSTTSFVTTPQADPGTTLGGTWAYSILTGSGQVTTRVCANVSVTPNSVKYTVKIIK